MVLISSNLVGCVKRTFFSDVPSRTSTISGFTLDAFGDNVCSEFYIWYIVLHYWVLIKLPRFNPHLLRQLAPFRRYNRLSFSNEEYTQDVLFRTQPLETRPKATALTPPQLFNPLWVISNWARVNDIDVINLVDTPFPTPPVVRPIPVTPSPRPIAAPLCRPPAPCPPALCSGASVTKPKLARAGQNVTKKVMKKRTSKRPLVSPKGVQASAKAVVDYKKLWQCAMKKERQKRYREKIQKNHAKADPNSEAENLLAKILECILFLVTLTLVVCYFPVDYFICITQFLYGFDRSVPVTVLFFGRCICYLALVSCFVNRRTSVAFIIGFVRCGI